MTIAITDACIFIDLHDLELIYAFFMLDLEIHTSLDVINELWAHQQAALSAYRSAGRLVVHNLSMADRLAILAIDHPKSLSDIDKTVLFLAEKLGAMVLSSDKAVRQFAKKRSIPYHGLLWIFDRLVERQIVPPAIAGERLQRLMATNLVYQNNAEMMLETGKRIKMWGEKR
jgi:hypothetical protein